MTQRISPQEIEEIERRSDPQDVGRLTAEIRGLYNLLDDTAISRAQKLAETLLTNNSSYHNHKETMAHAGFLLEVALFAAIISAESWPLSWVPDTPVSSEVFTCVGFCILWLFIHIFVRWQLRNRRWAALQCSGMLRAIRKWVTEPPCPEDLQPFQFEESDLAKPSKWMTALDFLIPWPSARIPADVGYEGYPKAIIEGLREQDKQGTGAVFTEVILTYGSIVICAIVLVRTFAG